MIVAIKLFIQLAVAFRQLAKMVFWDVNQLASPVVGDVACDFLGHFQRTAFFHRQLGNQAGGGLVF